MPDLPVWFANAAEIVAFARDVIFLIILIIVLIAIFVLFRKVTSLLESVKVMAKSAEELVTTVTESIAKPVASKSGAAFGFGKLVSFLWGLFKRKKD